MEEEIKVSELPETNNINDEDIMMIVQNGVNKKTQVQNINKLNNSISVEFLYRGTNKGDCTLIKTKNKNILIDLGSTNASSLISKLAEKGISKIDYLIISHFHSDHCLGETSTEFENLINSNSIDFSECIFYFPKTPDYTQFLYGDNESSLTRSTEGAFYIPQLEQDIVDFLTEKGLTIIRPEDKSVLTLDDYTSMKFLNSNLENFLDYYDVTFFHSGFNKYATSYNNFSLVVELIHNNHKFLFTGDIEPKAEEKITADLTYCDVYKVEHHGVNTDINSDYFSKITPKIAVVMNTISIPITRPTVPALKVLGTEIYSSNESHDIVVTSTIQDIFVISDKGKMQDENLDIGLGLDVNNIKDLYYLGAPRRNNIIPENGDLNDYLEPGIYRPKSVATISNIPPISYSFKMKVEHILDNQRIRQTIYSNGDVDTYVRYISTINGVTTFGNWYKVKMNTLGNAINSNTDLNDITTADEYYVETSIIAATLTNCPHTTSPFKLVVEYLNAEIRLRQTIYATNADSDTYVRTYTNVGWGTWKKVSMVAV